MYHQDLSGGASSPWPDGLTRSARRLTLHLPQGWPWETATVHSLPMVSIASPAIACLTATDGA